MGGAALRAPRGRTQGGATSAIREIAEERQRSETAPCRRNPKGAWGLRANAASLVGSDVPHRSPPRSWPSPRKPHARDPSHYRDGLLGVTDDGAGRLTASVYGS